MTIGRFFLVMFAGFAACFAAGVVLTVAALKPEWSGMFVDAFGDDSLNYIVAFGGLFASLAAFLPTIAIIVIGEVLRLRSVIYYALAFAAMSLFLFAYVSDWSLIAFNVDGHARRQLELMAAAGIVAGFVYWAIAGRTAGGNLVATREQ
ncbi:hypothetical protein GJW-30_1_04351 [Variibacter gotjawalensis]|uniref:Uncharacterized protein n=1 Tax=Variibacter gotjawalensis TaxID=1333996 RepID=A0A0S3Q0W3_9BRAD|nr:hypothetical protein [Variibacter gotjawalensis]NIK47630.1 hypothetical protein [Variibacter gotjawalensis]RZS49527.1 hypothetical protein EV661_1961 [Variibacter gotjawalensis]BAT61790.1 hypothetical protein GJW-30_1_04351 [Variibacter gotjawalensis]